MGLEIDLIAGLGNPDPAYLTTRHNAGFWFVDALAAECRASFGHDRKLHGDTAEVTLGGSRIRLLKPMTYMNDSGRSIGRALGYYKVPTDRLLVVYDELDLPPGRAQLKFSGGHAGHNGMRSVIEHIGPDFWRLRIGVGHPGQRDRVVGHVLRRASADEEQLIIESIKDGLETLPILLTHGAERAKTHLHSRRHTLDGDADAPEEG
jgi:peptidyl-tRNA hydrolase, PTH1 family